MQLQKLWTRFIFDLLTHGARYCSAVPHSARQNAARRIAHASALIGSLHRDAPLTRRMT
jgi:hypothetical protein